MQIKHSDIEIWVELFGLLISTGVRIKEFVHSGQSFSAATWNWRSISLADLTELTHGFEDNFVDVWNRAPRPDPPGEELDEDEEQVPPWSPTANDKNFFFDDEEDPVFQTIPGELL